VHPLRAPRSEPLSLSASSVCSPCSGKRVFVEYVLLEGVNDSTAAGAPSWEPCCNREMSYAPHPPSPSLASLYYSEQS